jgi:hypothetical protein
MNVEELNALERYLEIWMYNIRSAKVIQFQYIYLFLKTCFFFQTMLKLYPD